jgi:hypothetical protein
VSSIEKRGENVILRLAHSEVGYSCERTDRIQNVDADGTVHYDVDCRDDDHAKVLYSLTVTFPTSALPAAIPLRMGDQLGFFGVPNGTKDRHQWKGMFVTDLARHRNELGEWNPFFAEQISVPRGYGGY